MNFRRLFDILYYQKAKYPNKVALAHKVNHEWSTYHIDEVITEVNKISAGLLDLGLKKGDKAAIMAPIGSPIWNFLDFGMQQIGVIVVPIHGTISQKSLSYILNNAAVKYCFAAGLDLYEKLSSIQHECPELTQIYTFKKHPNIPSLDSILKTPSPDHLATFQTFKAAIHEDDLATIIYTSGTTGHPKGVMLSHKNIISNIKAIISLVPVNYTKRTISFLPMSHVFERMVTFTYMAVGASVYYAESLEQLGENIREVKPNYFAAVPRMLEKTYDLIIDRKLEKNKFLQRIIDWTIDLGIQYQGNKRKHGIPYLAKLKLADILVYRHWRKAMGGRVEGVVVGAAAMQEDLSRLFSAAGIKVREGYGLTETSPVVSFNRFDPGMFHFGTVGLPIPGVHLKIDEPNAHGNGEILVKGDNVMLGYYNDVASTAEVMDEDGWFHTGDIGKIVDKHFLKITDRKKDIFKTSSGKYIAPQFVENHLKSSPFIEQCLVLGFQKPYAAALIVPCFPVLRHWCMANGVHWTAPQFMVINPKVAAHMQAIVNTLNEGLTKHEQVRKFELLHEEWSIESGEVTPTMKVIRPVVLLNNEAVIEKLYD